eukprot:Anaeramoba_ignava/a227674_3.p1 GENE.a227674_3~~a227674_3.p1  ORF type:complete len:129 (+),score=9.44 a227674_3:76-462(+)
MKKTIFMDKYPVFSLELDKSEVEQKNVPEIIEYFKAKIEAHPVAKFIAVFDHYSHTKGLNGEIAPEILDAQNIVFCFGPVLPNTKMLAVRPRSIGIAELEDKFVVEFLEVPKEQLHELMESWAKDLKK